MAASAPAIATGAGNAASPRTGAVSRFAWRYHASMLSAALVAGALGLVSAAAMDGMALLPALLGLIAVLLVGVNLLGSLVLYRPVHRYLARVSVDRAKFERRVRILPAASALWVGVLTVVALTGFAYVGHGSFQALAGDSTGALMASVVHIGVFAAYLGLYAYLLVVHFCIGLRRHLWMRGDPLAPGVGRFGMRLAVSLVVVALGPLLIALSDQWDRPAPMAHTATPPHSPAMAAERNAMAEHHRRYMEQTLHMDVLGALLLSLMVAFLLARGMSRSLDGLLEAMRRVDAGDLEARSPVVSDDEFGLLTERFNRMLAGLRERERLRRTFGRFVPESVASALATDEGAIAPQEREATVLFTDIERFTEIAASLSPGKVVEMLNAYFERVAGIIHRHGGVITQFQGDAVLASFNLPALDPAHARHALDAALEIRATLSTERFADGLRLVTRVGVSSGSVVGGTVGGGGRLGYTVHGDTVNLAARLEGLNKTFGSGVLLSARTAELLDGAVPLRARGEVTVRGFDAPLPVFEPIGDPEARA